MRRLKQRRPCCRAQSLGLGYWRTLRLIVLPQALNLVIPAQVNYLFDAGAYFVISYGMSRYSRHLEQELNPERTR